jgi:hypothetical protein
MGAWGGGLYDSDFARDLKGLINGVLRAPLTDDEALAEIWTAQGKGAVDADACDYWLVLADQLERRGMPRPEVLERAIAIIETGEDLAAMGSLGARPSVVAKRRKDTARLLERLRQPRPQKARRPLRAPQPLLVTPGEALTWPTDRGDSINPYVPSDQLWKLGGFNQDGWGFGLVVDAGHHYEVLAWYAVQVLMWRRPERPTPELAPHCRRSEPRFGTMTEQHFQRARVERLGPAPPEAFGPAPHPQTSLRSSRRAVLEDLGIWGALGLDAFNSSIWPAKKFPYPAPSGAPLDPDEPDQRPGFGWANG